VSEKHRSSLVVLARVVYRCHPVPADPRVGCGGGVVTDDPEDYYVTTLVDQPAFRGSATYRKKERCMTAILRRVIELVGVVAAS
jgi:hypothetical protein